MASPWDMIGGSSRKPTLEEELASMGAAALANGQVTPSEVQQTAAGPIPKPGVVKKNAAPKRKPVKGLAQQELIPPPTAHQLSLQMPSDEPGWDELPSNLAMPADPVEVDQPRVTRELIQRLGKTPQEILSNDRGYAELSDDTKEEIKRRNAIKSALDNYQTPEQQQARYAQALQAPGVQEVARGIEGQEDQLGLELMQPQQVDLQPIKDLVNSVWGSKFTNSGTTARNDAQRKMVLDYMEKIQDNKRALHQSIMDSFKGQKSGQTIVDQLTENNLINDLVTKEGMKPKGGLGKSGGGDPSVKVARFQNGFEAIPEIKKPKEMIQQSNGLSEVFTGAGNNWVGDKMLQMSLLQAARLYPISNLDVQQFQGNPGALERMSQMLERVVNGRPLLKEDRQAIVDYTNALRVTAGNEINRIADDYIDGVGSHYGYDKATGKKILLSHLASARQVKTTDKQVQDAKAKSKKPAGGGAPAAGRVKVKNKEGVIGSIPESQLQDAIANGYTEVK
jgi:hypothetical protein